MDSHPQSKPDFPIREARLRILATSDLHMHLLSFDYVKSCANKAGSLAKIATLIRQAREEAAAANEICLLIDNGDTWQGNPLADILARGGGRKLHPMTRAMNYLHYDAVGIGNHDFDFGIKYLSDCISKLSASVICSNIQSESLEGVAEYALLERRVDHMDGTCETFRIGILSSTPDRTYISNRHHLADRAVFQRPLPVLRQGAKHLRAKGADVVVVLAHMGFPQVDEGVHAQNELAQVAAIPEVDAVVGGHTHQRFPDQRITSLEKKALSIGLVQGTPVVQPGAAGSDLGQIRVTLSRPKNGRGWKIEKAKAFLTSVKADTNEDAAVVKLAANAHRDTIAFLDQPAAKILKPMNTFFALARPSPVQALMATAKHHMIANAIEDTELAALPLLSVASATLTGGLDGPDNFISLPAGEIKNRHIAGLNPYANQVWAVRATGARVIDWLERSAMIFNTLAADAPDQMLINPNVPGFRYDAVFGLSYVIDPRKAPGFDDAGRKIAGRAGRVSRVTWQGQPLDPSMDFLVATTDHRAGGGGIYQPFKGDKIVVKGKVPLQTAVHEYLQNPCCDEIRSARPWQLAPDMGVSAILLSSPEAAEHLDEIREFAPETCGFDREGFLKVRLHL